MINNQDTTQNSNPYDKANAEKARRKGLRDAAQARLRAAIKARDMRGIEAAQAEIDSLSAASGKKKGKAVWADPMAPDAVAKADQYTLRELLENHSRAIHPDLGGPVIPGILARLREGAAAAGEALSPALERELCRSIHRKVCESAAGLGTSYVNAANQVLRRVAQAKTVKALELPDVGDKLWLGRREPEDLHARFEREWAEAQTTTAVSAEAAE